jgi:D-alanyl-D-alanine carboxypeptidase
VIGKTGWTRSAKRCFVGAASDQDREVLVAVLGSVDLWGDLDRLIAYGLASPSEGPRWPSGAEWTKARMRDDSDWRAAAGRDKAARQAKAAASTAAKPAAVAQPVDGKEFRYDLHVAAFRSRAQAYHLQRQVAAKGYQATVEQLRTRRPLFRVTVIGFPTRASARAAARVLGKAHRVDPQIVAVRA